ncbi:hypothetical protein [Acidipila sp. EB88]|uniref:hypothetical protein n=1 Tax=Acidipila sp. EB88 TaxID=2305226 RepID=UPI000F5D664F|nr:hypothetical protein [Acidipila sp. EB88]
MNEVLKFIGTNAPALCAGPTLDKEGYVTVDIYPKAAAFASHRLSKLLGTPTRLTAQPVELRNEPEWLACRILDQALSMDARGRDFAVALTKVNDPTGCVRHSLAEIIPQIKAELKGREESQPRLPRSQETQWTQLCAAVYAAGWKSRPVAAPWYLVPAIEEHFALTYQQALCIEAPRSRLQSPRAYLTVSISPLYLVRRLALEHSLPIELNSWSTLPECARPTDHISVIREIFRTATCLGQLKMSADPTALLLKMWETEILAIA